LRPRSLVQQVRGRVLSTRGSTSALEEIEADEPNKYQIETERRQVDATDLGIKVARDRRAFEELKGEIVTGQGNNYYFGAGLAKGAENPKELWRELSQKLAVTSPSDRDVRVFCGMLSELHTGQARLTDELLDDALVNEPLAQLFPLLQTSVPLTQRGMNRLITSIDIGKAPPLAYANAYLSPTFNANLAADVAKYILKLSEIPDGDPVAIHTLSGLFFTYRQDKQLFAPEIVAAGRELLRRMTFDRRNLQREDYHLARLVEICLVGDEGSAIARVICDRLRTANAAHHIYGMDHNGLLAALFKDQPQATLDGLLTGDEKLVSAGRHVIKEAGRFHGSAINEANEGAIFDWCEQDPLVRFPLAASVVSAFKVSNDGNPVEWNPIAERLVHAAPNPIAVMQELVRRFRPMQWSGSRSAILEANAKLLDGFDARGNQTLEAFVAEQKSSLMDEARTELEYETKRDSARDERFE
jgi:hypothetical protein